MDIVLGFDGTCVTHEYPAVGKDIGAVPVLRELVDNGHRLILFSVRADHPEREIYHLRDALQWFADREIPLYGIQCNPTQKEWTSSPKAFGEVYIDEAALGCPLVWPENGRRPYADWNAIRELLNEIGLL